MILNLYQASLDFAQLVHSLTHETSRFALCHLRAMHANSGKAPQALCAFPYARIFFVRLYNSSKYSKFICYITIRIELTYWLYHAEFPV